jgi:hypothetical protein
MEEARTCKDRASSGIYQVMPLAKEIANASETLLIEQASGGSNDAAIPFDDRVDLQRIVPAI